MKNCSNCQTILENNARFCIECGQAVEAMKISCGNCQTENPKTASFCFNCGNTLKQQQQSPPPPIEEELSVKQFLGDFMRALRHRILVDHQSKKIEAYLEAFYTTGFNKYFISAAGQLAIDVTHIPAHQSHRFIQEQIDNLLDFFIILYCKNINKTVLPEAILKYQHSRLTSMDFEKMLYDFLNLEAENEQVYTNFIEMPLEKLKTASKSFLFPEKKERIWLICDQSVLGSYKEGFAITEKALYWKAPFEAAQVVYFNQIRQLTGDKDWILINNLFFNINYSLNLKMLYLLRRLKILFAEH